MSLIRELLSENPEDETSLTEDEIKWLYENFEFLKHGMNKDFYLEVKKGKVPGHTGVHLVGENPSVSTAEEVIWVGGGSYTFLTTAATLEAISTDAADTAAGTGTRTIHVYGLDANFLEIDEVIIMAGLGASAATTQFFIRVNQVLVESVGGYGNTNVGNITIRESGGAGVDVSIVEAGEGQDGNAIYTIPANKTGYMIDASVTMDAGKDIAVHIKKREDANIIVAPFGPTIHVHHWVGINQPIVNEEFKANHVFPPKTDLWFVGNKTGATDAHIDIESNLVLVEAGF